MAFQHAHRKTNTVTLSSYFTYKHQPFAASFLFAGDGEVGIKVDRAAFAALERCPPPRAADLPAAPAPLRTEAFVVRDSGSHHRRSPQYLGEWHPALGPQRSSSQRQSAGLAAAAIRCQGRHALKPLTRSDALLAIPLTRLPRLGAAGCATGRGRRGGGAAQHVIPPCRPCAGPRPPASAAAASACRRRPGRQRAACGPAYDAGLSACPGQNSAPACGGGSASCCRRAGRPSADR